MVKRGRPKKDKEEGKILTSEMFRDNPKKEQKYNKEEYDELYPEYTKEEPEKEVEEIIEETKRDFPISVNTRKDVYNRLVGIQNLANEWRSGKYKKIIMLSEEIKSMLELDKEEEEKDEWRWSHIPSTRHIY